MNSDQQLKQNKRKRAYVCVSDETVSMKMNYLGNGIDEYIPSISNDSFIFI